MLKLIILDRDGVINEDSDNYIKNATEWQALPGSLQAIATLNQVGLKVGIASNQSGLSRGLFTHRDLAQIHEKMLRELATVGGTIDAIAICPHGPDALCACRKPNIGLLQQLAQQFQAAPHEILMIGDAITDLLAAHTFGCRAWLVTTGKGTKTASLINDTPIFPDLAHACTALIKMIPQP